MADLPYRPILASHRFPMLSPLRHVAASPPKGIAKRGTVAGVDIGFASLHAYVELNVYDGGRLHAIQCVTASEIAFDRFLARIRELGVATATYVGVERAAWQRDRSTGERDSDRMREHGFVPLRVDRRPRDRLRDITAALVRQTIEGGLTIHPDCTTIIKAIRETKVTESTDGKVKWRTPQHAHVIDALGYAIHLVQHPGRVDLMFGTGSNSRAMDFGHALHDGLPFA